MKRILIPLMLILSMLLSACGGDVEAGGTTNPTETVATTNPTEAAGRTRPPVMPTFEEMLAMSDVDLAFIFAWIDLTEQNGAYYLDPASYECWEPKTEEGTLKTPYEFIGLITSPYGEADIEDLALCMTKRFIHMFMYPNQIVDASFLITAYKDLSVEVYTEDELPEKYRHVLEEVPADTPFTYWYVVPTISYQFIGDIEGVGSGSDEWVTDLGGDYCLSLRLYKGQESTNYSIAVARPSQ
ncbi:MAG: hypothetical protein ACOX7P_08410 [Oscillospiraceae bacterium]